MDNLIFIIAPAITWLYYRLTLPNQRWEFDFAQMQASFNLLLTRYVGVLCFMVVTDLAAVALGRFNHVASTAVACSLAGAGYSFALIVWLLVKYEVYLHHRYPKTGMSGESPYTTSEYAMTRALAWSSVMFSVIGVAVEVWL